MKHTDILQVTTKIELKKDVELTLELLELIHLLKKNAEATDDDLAETWKQFFKQSEKCRNLLDHYIAAGNS